MKIFIIQIYNKNAPDLITFTAAYTSMEVAMAEIENLIKLNVNYKQSENYYPGQVNYNDFIDKDKILNIVKTFKENEEIYSIINIYNWLMEYIYSTNPSNMRIIESTLLGHILE